MRNILSWIGLGLLAMGCRGTGSEGAPSETADTEGLRAEATQGGGIPLPAPAGSTSAGPCGGGSCGQHEPAGCDEGPQGPVQVAAVSSAVDPATGRTLAVVGNKLGGLTPVSIGELAAHPESYRGKNVRLEGDVVGMCHHRRGWFAVRAAGDKSGPFVRVITSPVFLVPAGSIGKTARTEGTVELIDVAAPMAAHLAKEHQMGEGKPSQSIVLRATGAEFL